MELLLDNGAQIDVKDHLGRSAAWFATHGSSEACLFRLAERGADLSEPSNDGWSPLHLAASKGILSIIGILVEHGCNIDCQLDGKTPAYIASGCGQSKALSFFANNGANLKLVCEDGSGVVHI